MELKALKEWQKEIERASVIEITKIFDRIKASQPLFDGSYLSQTYGIKPKKPTAYSCYAKIMPGNVAPPLWTTLPFYKLQIVDVPPYLNEKRFYQFYGMDVKTFKIFCEYGRIQPLIAVPTSYRNRHFLDPILKEKPPTLLAGHSTWAALAMFIEAEFGVDLTKEAETLFPRHPVGRISYEALTTFGYGEIPSAVSKLVREKKIPKGVASVVLKSAYVFYLLPYLAGGGETFLLSEDANRWFTNFGWIEKAAIQSEIREDLLDWLGFRLPSKIDRKYVSKYIEICDNLSPSIHKVVMKIENKLRGYESARDELSLIIGNLESELALISKRRDTLAGSVKWLTAIPISIAQDILGKARFEETRKDLKTAKVPVKEYVAEKVRRSAKVGEVISAITRKGYIVRNVWKIREKTKALKDMKNRTYRLPS